VVTAPYQDDLAQFRLFRVPLLLQEQNDGGWNVATAKITLATARRAAARNLQGRPNGFIAVGWTLVLVGALSTIPLAANVLAKRR
jgi:hypothetical protein